MGIIMVVTVMTTRDTFPSGDIYCVYTCTRIWTAVTTIDIILGRNNVAKHQYSHIGGHAPILLEQG